VTSRNVQRCIVVGAGSEICWNSRERILTGRISDRKEDSRLDAPRKVLARLARAKLPPRDNRVALSQLEIPDMRRPV